MDSSFYVLKVMLKFYNKEQPASLQNLCLNNLKKKMCVCVHYCLRCPEIKQTYVFNFLLYFFGKFSFPDEYPILVLAPSDKLSESCSPFHISHVTFLHFKLYLSVLGLVGSGSKYEAETRPLRRSSSALFTVAPLLDIQFSAATYPSPPDHGITTLFVGGAFFSSSSSLFCFLTGLKGTTFWWCRVLYFTSQVPQ